MDSKQDEVALTEPDLVSIKTFITEQEDLLPSKQKSGVQLPLASAPPKSMNSLIVTLKSALIKDYQPVDGEPELKALNTEAQQPNRQTVGIVRAGDLWSFLSQTTQPASVFVIDLRMQKEAKLNSIKFPQPVGLQGAVHFQFTDTAGKQPLVTMMKAWMDENPSDIPRLLQASHVVIHCTAGQNRSPPSVIAYDEFKNSGDLLSYAKSIKNDKIRVVDLKAPLNQRTCLLVKGFASVEKAHTTYKLALLGSSLQLEADVRKAREVKLSQLVDKIFTVW